MSPAGELLPQQDHLCLRARSNGDDPWQRLPDLPSTVETLGRTLTWAGGSIGRGGSSSGIRGERIVNTAERWTIASGKVRGSRCWPYGSAVTTDDHSWEPPFAGTEAEHLVGAHDPDG